MPGPPSGHQSPRAAAAAERKAKIWQRKIDACTDAQIAAEFGISQTRVRQILDEALKDITAPVADDLRKVAKAKLDQAERAVLEVLRRRHVQVSGGKVVRDVDPATGVEVELEDDGPVLTAVQTLLRVEARRAAMFGYDAPQQTVVQSYSYTVNGVDPADVK